MMWRTAHTETDGLCAGILIISLQRMKTTMHRHWRIGETRDGEVEEKLENNTAQTCWLNDSATGARRGVSASLCTRHTNCNIPVTIHHHRNREQKQTVDPYS